MALESSSFAVVSCLFDDESSSETRLAQRVSSAARSSASACSCRSLSSRRRAAATRRASTPCPPSFLIRDLRTAIVRDSGVEHASLSRDSPSPCVERPATRDGRSLLSE